MLWVGFCEGEHDMPPCLDDNGNPVRVFQCSEDCGYTCCDREDELVASLFPAWLHYDEFTIPDTCLERASFISHQPCPECGVGVPLTGGGQTCE